MRLRLTDFTVFTEKLLIFFFIYSMRFYNPSSGENRDGFEKPILQPGLHEYANPCPDDGKKLDMSIGA